MSIAGRFYLVAVKHSHDKKKAFDANNAKIANIDSSNQILKFGRKYLNYGADITFKDKKHGEEEESAEEEGRDPTWEFQGRRRCPWSAYLP